MTLPKDPIRQWIIGVLMVIVSALSSVAYASVTGRITDLETDGKTAVEMRSAIKTQLAVLQSTVDRMEITISRMDANQAEMLDTIRILQDNDRIQGLRSSRLSQQSATDSQRWNAAMDLQTKPKRKKD